MNINDQIRLSAIISLIVVIVISGSILYTSQEKQDLEYQENLAAELVKGGNELSQLSNEYFLFGEPRAYLQWKDRYASLQPVLNELKSTGSKEERSISIIRESNTEIGRILGDVQQTQEFNENNLFSPVTGSPAIWYSNQIQTQGLIFEAWQLRHIYNNNLSEIRFLNDIFIVALVLAMFVIISINYLLLSRRIILSIGDVNKGSKEFASGNLEYRIPVTRDDEIGGIARRLNTMAEQIQIVTASRDELNREISEHKLTEEKLRTTHRDLENKIIEQKESKDHILYLNQILRTIRTVNQLLVFEKDPDILPQKICDIMGKSRGFENVWIVRFNNKGEFLRMYKSGIEEVFTDLENSLSRGNIPWCLKDALQQNGVIQVNKLTGKCNNCPLFAFSSGRITLTCPLRYEGENYGVLSAILPEKVIPDEEDLGLFNEICEDVGFGLHTIGLTQRESHSLAQIQQNMMQLGAVNDEIRNPLTIIRMLNELDQTEANRKIVDEQICLIDELIKKLDMGWVGSEKIWNYLMKHHGIKKQDDNND